MFLMVDYFQIEMCIMVYLFGDEGLIEVFNSGEDLYWFVGVCVFGVELGDVIFVMCIKVKVMLYGFVYGFLVFGLLKQLCIEQLEVKQLMVEYFV